MCGRYTLTTDLEILEEYFHVAASGIFLIPRYNIAPTQQVPVVIWENGRRRLRMMQWGLIPHWAKDASISSKLFNARSETIEQKPAFKESFYHRRCLVPADGFFEWERKGSHKSPVYIRLPHTALYAYAAVWDRWIGPDHKPVDSFTILTTEPNAFIEPLHHRMAVILADPHSQETWLTSQDISGLKNLLKPFEGKMESIYVSPLVNSVHNEGPQCIQPKEDAASEQLDIFNWIQ